MMSTRQRLLWLGRAALFGLLVAVAYHLLHGPTEAEAGRDMAHFFFHLAVEGLIAIYGMVIGLAVQGAMRRVRHRS